MRIYIDVDDVLCETAAHLCGLAARAFGRRVAYADVFQFDLQQVFGFSDAEMRQFMARVHAPDELLAYAVTSGAPEGVRTLRAAGHAVEIVTGRPAATHGATAAWLAAAGLGTLPVFYVDKYGRAALSGPAPDEPPTLSLGQLFARRYDAVVDDSPLVLKHLAVVWPRTRILVYDRPWNRAFPLSANMTRVRGWRDIVAVLAGRDAAVPPECRAAAGKAEWGRRFNTEKGAER